MAPQNARIAVWCLVKSDGERREDRVAVARRDTVERFVDMFETGLKRDAMTGQQRQLRRPPSEAFQRREAMIRGKLANRVHAGVEIEGGEARSRLADLGNALPDLGPHGR